MKGTWTTFIKIIAQNHKLFDSEMSHPGISMINILTYALIYEMVILHHSLQKGKKEWKQPKCQQMSS